ncbi:hypothetical protein [Actinophytocola glycyrrhizae]|uniref:Uncharacterized protein n=1 Tax=Actinophytocola glycyrrhizae TaxID=2044873 RepID=A0ABV9SB88_9PSEU
MTEPQPVMAQAEQDQLTRQVGRSLLTVAGEGWQRVRAEYRSAGRHIEVDVSVTGPDGVEHPVRPPQEVVEGLGRLRQGMYRPGRGTWLSGLYLLEPPSSFSAEFEPDIEPRWRRVPPPIGFADELKFFPRADEHIPDWLRQRAGLPPLPTAEDQPPAGGPSGSQGAPQQSGEPTPPRGNPATDAAPQQGSHHSGQPGFPAATPQFGGQPGNPRHAEPTPPGQFANHGGERTPPPGFPAATPQPGAHGEPAPPPGNPASGAAATQPGSHRGGQPGFSPATPRFDGRPGNEVPAPQHGDHHGGHPGFPASAPQFGGQPASPPGFPAAPPPFRTHGDPTPPRGNPADEAAAPQPGNLRAGEPTPPPGVNPGPTPPPGFPAPFGAHAGPGIPSAPQPGGQQPAQEPDQPGGQFVSGSESWFGGQVAEAESRPRGFGVPATPFPPDEPHR